MKYVRTLSAFQKILNDKSQVYVALKLDDKNREQLTKIGFPDKLKDGMTLLPKPIGPQTRFNSEGKFGPPLRDLPKVPYTIERYWEWNDWQGNQHSKIIHQNRLKWDRDYIPGPSIELTITDVGGQKFIRSPLLEVSEDGRLVAAINLFLEIFRDVDFLDKDRCPIVKNLIKLNWELLPAGTRLSDISAKDLKPLLVRKSKNKEAISRHRLGSIERYKPNFVAIGNGGFNGYVVYGFSKRGIYILESMFENNATYIFGGDWRELSRMTKTEILSEQLQLDRLIHNEFWLARLNGLFKEAA